MTDARSSDQPDQGSSWVSRHMRAVGLAGCLALALAGAGAGATLASGNSGNSGTGKATAASGKRHRHMHGRHGKQGAGNKAGVFHTVCTYSHSAGDDPILMPGKPGASMLHDFFGNTTTKASSTAPQLVGGPTTCATSADSSGYWTPALYDNGQRVLPSKVATYWRGASRTASTTPLPAGLQMIAGNEQATSPQPADHVYWQCHAVTGSQSTRNGPKSSAPHECPAGQEMLLTINFPSCWDGHTLSAVGQDNVVYPSGSRCPASHPVALSRLALHVHYPNRPGGKFTLSMGPGMQGSIYSEHADFLDGWNITVLDRLTTTCLDTHSKCGKVTGPNGTPQPAMGSPSSSS
ncbi:MAG: hypothetical protein DLM64_09465 [Solirubrobacterales bacterium]|nr:MAG: hypothetical protein DLM63_06595 [Solirubrobacterales bacterium]PZS10026.1 MAG: hypothetical protein DLM64_09465 [Solirubrobacterales bacterium]